MCDARKIKLIDVLLKMQLVESLPHEFDEVKPFLRHFGDIVTIEQLQLKTINLMNKFEVSFTGGSGFAMKEQFPCPCVLHHGRVDNKAHTYSRLNTLLQYQHIRRYPEK